MINIVTYPDLLFTDAQSILVLHPGQPLQQELQDYLSNSNYPVNLYFYSESEYNVDVVNWMLSVFKQCDYAIADIDNCPCHVRDLLSYILWHRKSYWLSNSQDSIYNHISSNQVYNLDFLNQEVAN